MELDYEVRDTNDLTSYPPFIFDLFDEDDELIGKSEDYLARAIIQPSKCSLIFADRIECSLHGK